MSKSRLIIENDVSFVWNGRIITKDQIDAQFDAWRGFALLASIGVGWHKDERAALLAVMYEDLPFTKLVPESP